MYSGLLKNKHVVGLKQSKRAVLEGLAAEVYIASDADRRVSAPLIELCTKMGIPVLAAPPMKEFGKLLEIEVSAAFAATLL